MSAGIQVHPDVVGEDVWLTVPPFSEYLRTVRLVAADAAGRAGLDYDEIEDFRIGTLPVTWTLCSTFVGVWTTVPGSRRNGTPSIQTSPSPSST